MCNRAFRILHLIDCSPQPLHSKGMSLSQLSTLVAQSPAPWGLSGKAESSDTLPVVGETQGSPGYSPECTLCCAVLWVGMHVPGAAERVSIVYQWTQQLLGERIDDGGLQRASPILAHAYQVLSAGYTSFEHCRYPLWFRFSYAFCTHFIDYPEYSVPAWQVSHQCQFTGVDRHQMWLNCCDIRAMCM